MSLHSRCSVNAVVHAAAFTLHIDAAAFTKHLCSSIHATALTLLHPLRRIVSPLSSSSIGAAALTLPHLCHHIHAAAFTLPHSSHSAWGVCHMYAAPGTIQHFLVAALTLSLSRCIIGVIAFTLHPKRAHCSIYTAAFARVLCRCTRTTLSAFSKAKQDAGCWELRRVGGQAVGTPPHPSEGEGGGGCSFF